MICPILGIDSFHKMQKNKSFVHIYRTDLLSLSPKQKKQDYAY